MNTRVKLEKINEDINPNVLVGSKWVVNFSTNDYCWYLEPSDNHIPDGEYCIPVDLHPEYGWVAIDNSRTPFAVHYC